MKLFGNYAEMSAGGRTGCYEWDVFGAPVALKDKKQDKKGRGKMEIGLIFKIAAVGILVTILSQVLKHSGREEHAFLISLAFKLPEKEKLVDWYRMRDTDHQAIP